MSIQAVAWALEQDIPARPKLVLVALANHANHVDGYCWLRVETIAQEAACGERSVPRFIDALAKYGYVRKVPRRAEDGRQRANDYWLLFRSEKVSWPVKRRKDYRGDDDDDDTIDCGEGDSESCGAGEGDSEKIDSNATNESVGPTANGVTPNNIEEPSKSNLSGGRTKTVEAGLRSYAPKPQELDAGWYERTSREARALKKLCEIVGKETHFDNMGGQRTIHYPHEITPSLLALAEVPPRGQWIRADNSQAPAWFNFARKVFPNLHFNLRPGALVPPPGYPPRADGTWGRGPPDALADEDTAQLQKTG